MTGITYTVDAPLLDDELKKLNGYEAVAGQKLRDAMTKSVIKVQGGAREGAPVGVSGRLRQSIGWNVSGGGSDITGWVGSTMKNEVYPSVMEGGRRPGTMPPSSALERWVHIVLGVPENEMRSVAYLVARAIQRRGIKGKFFLWNSYLKFRSVIIGYFHVAGEEILKAMKVS
jgi:hypothetical protein